MFYAHACGVIFNKQYGVVWPAARLVNITEGRLQPNLCRFGLIVTSSLLMCAVNGANTIHLSDYRIIELGMAWRFYYLEMGRKWIGRVDKRRGVEASLRGFVPFTF
ncbi:hypothetical protein RRG08_014862 [Elysia crispata]|uniref:Uncharacterized protein n=1 Tax=Elysia crispata TaxID=231223 RepID=A0AAE1E2G3_9GAST|nr:hypothetical protein RRG08_014862 [Elysia crispata]